MTAEVAVLNPIGVALAADSAVSIGRDSGKVFTSVEKLFQLASGAPIGVMIYNLATFMELPWETIVKEYRKQSATNTLATVDEYASDFLRFLEQIVPKWPRIDADAGTTSLIRTLFEDVREELRLTLNKEAEGCDGLEETDIDPIAAKVFASRLTNIKQSTRIKGFSGKFVTAVRRKYRSDTTRIIGETFGKVPLSAKSLKTLSAMAGEMLTREYFGPRISGVVIAGFGEQEFFPSLVAIEFEEMVLGKCRRRTARQQRIGPDNAAAIVPFAQQEMVHAFLSGVDQSMLDFFQKSTASLFTGTLASLLKIVEGKDPSLANGLQSSVDTALRDMLPKLFEQWSKLSENYWRPVVNIAATLPKDELGAMAEALVNLTKFRRRVTPERETVGGPIDLAVITKGDGFVWIKRKHYFDPALNPRVMGRYQSERNK